MFRINFLTEDKNVAIVLRAVAGKAHDLECVPVDFGTVMPAALAGHTNGASHPLVKNKPRGKNAANPDRKPLENFFNPLKRGQKITASMIADGIEKLGWSRKSITYAVTIGVKQKLLRPLQRGLYEVL